MSDKSQSKPYIWYDPETGQTWTNEAIADGYTTEGLIPLYEARQPRQPLTDEQIAYCIFEARLGAEGALKRNGSSSYRIARAIERAHGIGGAA